MVLFKLRKFLLFGPVVLSAAVYNLRGWHTVFLWLDPANGGKIKLMRLPVRARAGW